MELKVIIDCRTDESCNLKKKKNLGFRLHDTINTKEQTVINSIKDAIGWRKLTNSVPCFRLQD